MALLKLLQIRTLFMNDILQYVSLYIYLPLDLNKHRHGAEWPDMFSIHTSLASISITATRWSAKFESR